jgi:hypothetical protein
MNIVIGHAACVRFVRTYHHDRRIAWLTPLESAIFTAQILLSLNATSFETLAP